MSENDLTVLFALGIVVATVIGYFRPSKREAQALITEARRCGWSGVRTVGWGVAGESQGHWVHFSVTKDEDDRMVTMKSGESGLPRLVVTSLQPPLAIDGWLRSLVGKEWPPPMTTNDPTVNARFEIYAEDSSVAQRVLNDRSALEALKSVIRRENDRLIVAADGIELRSLNSSLPEAFEAISCISRALKA